MDDTPASSSPRQSRLGRAARDRTLPTPDFPGGTGSGAGAPAGAPQYRDLPPTDLEVVLYRTFFPFLPLPTGPYAPYVPPLGRRHSDESPHPAQTEV